MTRSHPRPLGDAVGSGSGCTYHPCRGEDTRWHTAHVYRIPGSSDGPLPKRVILCSLASVRTRLRRIRSNTHARRGRCPTLCWMRRVTCQGLAAGCARNRPRPAGRGRFYAIAVSRPGLGGSRARREMHTGYVRTGGDHSIDPRPEPRRGSGATRKAVFACCRSIPGEHRPGRACGGPNGLWLASLRKT